MARYEGKGKVNESITEVVFRKWNDGGEILALFPYDIQQYVGECGSYAHYGQHSSATYRHCIDCSKPAKESEYIDLKAELERIGYKLKVIQRRNFNKFIKAVDIFRGLYREKLT